MKLQINVTKEVLEQSKMCGREHSKEYVGSSCAIALAVRDIFPNAYVETTGISTKGYGFKEDIEIPDLAQDFIQEFDSILPEARVQMQPISFEVEVPDAVINRINIEEVTQLLKDHPTLQII